MADISLATLMAGFNKFIEALPVQSTADTGSDATKIVDSALSIYPDSYFDNVWWIYITSGSASGDKRLVQTFTKSSTTLVPYVNFSAAVANGDTYEIHKHNPDEVKASINDAITSLWAMPPAPWLFKKVVFESLGLSLLTSNAALGQKNVIVADESLFFVGQILTISDDDGSEDCTIASINATTHTLTMEDNLTNAYATAKNAQVVAKDGKYFNLGATIGEGRITGVFLRADSTSKRKRYTAFNVIQSEAGVGQLYFPSDISVDDQTWIVEAIAPLGELDAPTDTITLEEHRVKLLYVMAAYHLYGRKANDISSGDVDRLEALAVKYATQATTIYKHLRMALPREFAHLSYDSDSDSD